MERWRAGKELDAASVKVLREALAGNVKPKFAVDAMVGTVGQALRG